MKKLLLLMFWILILNSCKSYVHLIHTNSDIPKNNENLYVFENDTVKIVYGFWAEKGVVSFSIYNKLDIPLYIDWRKSAYIDNSVKLNYWEDKEESVSIFQYNKYIYKEPKDFWLRRYIGGAVGVSNTVTKKPERITFIPPKSFFYSSRFLILPTKIYRIKSETNSVNVPRNGRSRKNTTIYSKQFRLDNSPLIFRNFLTFSITEVFEEEFYVDNKFYISEIEEMDKKHFFVYKNGKFYTPFKRADLFYKEIPSSWSIEKRKK